MRAGASRDESCSTVTAVRDQCEISCFTDPVLSSSEPRRWKGEGLSRWEKERKKSIMRALLATSGKEEEEEKGDLIEIWPRGREH